MQIDSSKLCFLFDYKIIVSCNKNPRKNPLNNIRTKRVIQNPISQFHNNVFFFFPQSCTVAKSNKFWQVTGQSNLTDRIEDCSTGQSAVVWVQKNKLWNLLLQPAICMPSLIVQWLARVLYVEPLHMTVKLAYNFTVHSLCTVGFLLSQCLLVRLVVSMSW